MARLATFALILVATVLGFRSDTISRRPTASSILVLYVGAEDCAPCRAWQAGDGAAFRDSADFARLTYREVKSPHLATVLNDENWPDDLRSYRSRLGRGDGVPLWLVATGQEVVQQQSGTSQWRATVLPTIAWLLNP